MSIIRLILMAVGSGAIISYSVATIGLFFAIATEDGVIQPINRWRVTRQTLLDFASVFIYGWVVGSVASGLFLLIFGG